MSKSELQKPTRQTVLFSGRVQGVGFRYTTQQIARRFAVSGFVRNLTDGRVELVAEGAAEDVRQFIDEVCAAMSNNIAETSNTAGTATGEFGAFSIRR